MTLPKTTPAVPVVRLPVKVRDDPLTAPAEETVQDPLVLLKEGALTKPVVVKLDAVTIPVLLTVKLGEDAAFAKLGAIKDDATRFPFASMVKLPFVFWSAVPLSRAAVSVLVTEAEANVLTPAFKAPELDTLNVGLDVALANVEDIIDSVTWFPLLSTVHEAFVFCNEVPLTKAALSALVTVVELKVVAPAVKTPALETLKVGFDAALAIVGAIKDRAT